MEYLEIDGLGPVSRIGLGTWQFGSREWGYGDTYADRAARDIVRRARELGITLFDTAEIYGFGRSERILGEALGHERADVVVASKIFPVAPFPPVVRHRWAGSARRLGLTRIPLYQVHQPNPVVPGLGDHARDCASLLDDDRIGAVGVSNYSLDRWRAADAALGRPVISNQVQFSLAHAAPLDDLVPFAERENRLVIAYSPLAQGLLGGRYTVDQPPGRRPRGEPAVRHREPAPGRAAARPAPRGGRRAPGPAGADRPRLAASACRGSSSSRAPPASSSWSTTPPRRPSAWPPTSRPPSPRRRGRSRRCPACGPRPTASASGSTAGSVRCEEEPDHRGEDDAGRRAAAAASSHSPGERTGAHPRQDGEPRAGQREEQADATGARAAPRRRGVRCGRSDRTGPRPRRRPATASQARTTVTTSAG